jgi:hypothetical protein
MQSPSPRADTGRVKVSPIFPIFSYVFTIDTPCLPCKWFMLIKVTYY